MQGRINRRGINMNNIENILLIFVVSVVVNVTLLCIYEAGREFADTLIFIIKKKMDLLFTKENKLK